MDMLPKKTKMELQSFLGILKYIGKFSPRTAQLSKPL